MKDRFIFIATALESIELIQSYTTGYDLPRFLEDRKTQDAVIRNLEIIGQALKDLVVDSATVYPVAGNSRNAQCVSARIFGCRSGDGWETVQTNLEPLQQALEK